MDACSLRPTLSPGHPEDVFFPQKRGDSATFTLFSLPTSGRRSARTPSEGTRHRSLQTPRASHASPPPLDQQVCRSPPRIAAPGRGWDSARTPPASSRPLLTRCGAQPPQGAPDPTPPWSTRRAPAVLTWLRWASWKIKKIPMERGAPFPSGLPKFTPFSHRHPRLKVPL